MYLLEALCFCDLYGLYGLQCVAMDVRFTFMDFWRSLSCVPSKVLSLRRCKGKVWSALYPENAQWRKVTRKVSSALYPEKMSSQELWEDLVRIVAREGKFPILALLLQRVVAPLPSEERTHSFC